MLQSPTYYSQNVTKAHKRKQKTRNDSSLPPLTLNLQGDLLVENPAKPRAKWLHLFSFLISSLLQLSNPGS